ncbi:unnamed protein product [Parajaminaea phylloscopi]
MTSTAHASLPFVAASGPHQKKLQLSTAPREPTFPGVYVPGKPELTVDETIAAARDLGRQPAQGPSDRDESALRGLLDAHAGALHFRNLPLRTGDDFSRFLFALAEGAGWQPHVDKGLMVVRHPHAPNVATANDGPPDAPIGLHNEYALSSHYPAYICFFCASPPEEGGETPIASSLELYDRLRDRAPAYIDAIEHQGIAFGIHHPVERLANTLAGNSLYSASAFGPSDGSDPAGLTEEQRREVAESNVRALGVEGGWQPDLPDSAPNWQRRGFEAQWQPDGSLLALQRVPGVRQHPRFERPTYFTNLLNNYMYAEDHGSLEPPHHSNKTRLASGAPWLRVPPKIVGDTPAKDELIPRPWIDEVKTTTAELKVDVPWQLGDVLVLDNLAAQHGRNTWRGDRRLLASLWDRGVKAA